MAEYLSDEWLHDLDAALQASEQVRNLASLVIDQTVLGVPGRGDVHYRVWVDDQGGHAAPGARAAGTADIRLTTDYNTAVGIAHGTENAQGALARGRFRIGGDIESLTRHQDALAALDDATAAVRVATTFARAP